MKTLLVNPPHPSIGSRIPREHLPPLGLQAARGFLPLRGVDKGEFTGVSKKADQLSRS